MRLQVSSIGLLCLARACACQIRTAVRQAATFEGSQRRLALRLAAHRAKAYRPVIKAAVTRFGPRPLRP